MEPSPGKAVPDLCEKHRIHPTVFALYALDQLHLAARPSLRGNSQGLFYQIGCSGEPVVLHNRFLDPAGIFTVSRVAQHLTEKG